MNFVLSVIFIKQLGPYSNNLLVINHGHKVAKHIKQTLSDLFYFLESCI